MITPEDVQYICVTVCFIIYDVEFMPKLNKFYVMCHFDIHHSMQHSSFSQVAIMLTLQC